MAAQGAEPQSPEGSQVTLCLHMIVGNECSILARCLESAANRIGYFVICENGSLDHSMQIVREFFAGRNLAGEIHNLSFQDFGQTRNEALDICRASSGEFSHLLLLEADMELVVEQTEWPPPLEQAQYLLRQRTQHWSWSNVRVLGRELASQYVGRTHEYLTHGRTAIPLQGAWIRDHACGSNRPLKVQRDSAWLEECLREGSDPARNTFYLAQTYHSGARFSEAALFFQRRVDLGGWPEEVYLSRLGLADCLLMLGDLTGFQGQLWQAYRERPIRAEALYRLAAFHFGNGDYHECLRLCRLGERIGPCEDLLMRQDDLYHGKFALLLLTSQARLGKAPKSDGSRARRTCRRLSVDPEASLQTRSAAREIWKFCARQSSRLFGPTRRVPRSPSEATSPSVVPLRGPRVVADTTLAEFAETNSASVPQPVCAELALEHLGWVEGCVPSDHGWLRLARDVHGMHRFACCDDRSRLLSLTDPFTFCGSEGRLASRLLRSERSHRLQVEFHSARDGWHCCELAVGPVVLAMKPLDSYR